MIDVAEKSEANIDNLPPSERALQISYELHKEFNKENWEEKKSFHNEEHIRAVAEASDKLIKAAINGEDPLDIQGDIDKWNELHKDSPRIDIEQFRDIAKMAFAAHDWGNIMQDVEFDKEGNVLPIFLEKYTAENAELRSQMMFEKFVENNVDESLREIYKNVGKEIIWQTNFMNDADDPGYNKPFAQFARVCDQIGNDVFSENDDRLEGLLTEMLNEDPSKEINLDFFVNFAAKRIKGILPESEFQEDQIKAIYDAWEKDRPVEKTVEVQGNVSIKDAINFVKSIEVVLKAA